MGLFSVPISILPYICMAKYEKENLTPGGKLSSPPIFSENHAIKLRKRRNAAIGCNLIQFRSRRAQQNLHQKFKHFTTMRFLQYFRRQGFWKQLARHSIFMPKLCFVENLISRFHTIEHSAKPSFPNPQISSNILDSLFAYISPSKKIKKLPRAAKLHLEYAL